MLELTRINGEVSTITTGDNQIIEITASNSGKNQTKLCFDAHENIEIVRNELLMPERFTL